MDGLAKKNQLLDKLNSNTINRKQLDEECAYWYLDIFSIITKKLEPTPPQRWREFEDMNFTEKRDLPKEFWFLPEIKNYLDSKYEVIAENKSKLYWLRYYMNCLPEADLVSRDKFREKINEFIY